jgi:hypothetical protein
MERTDIYFSHNYELNPVAYCIDATNLGLSAIQKIVKDTDTCRVSIYGHIHGAHLNAALNMLHRLKGYKPTDIVTIQL